MIMKIAKLLFCCLLALSCSDQEGYGDEPTTANLYFPPNDRSSWQTTSASELNWNIESLQELYQFMEGNDTRAFLILKDGKIVVEKYWGTEITGINNFNQDSQWYWASAGKTVASVMVGIAQNKRLLNIEEPTSTYLCTGWTSMTAAQESKITVRHQLAMTTGLEYQGVSLDCTAPECLTYREDPGNQWYYHNAPYTLLHKVIERAGGNNLNQLTDEWLENPIGMKGIWRPLGDNIIYWSTARDAAKFGLLIQAEASWNGNQILSNSYMVPMKSTSQNLNPSYGFLWWLNGKISIQFPLLTTPFPTSLAPNAPTDMYSAMGKNGQFIDVVPSKGLVVVRLGENLSNDPAAIIFHNEMWEKLNDVLN